MELTVYRHEDGLEPEAYLLLSGSAAAALPLCGDPASAAPIENRVAPAQAEEPQFQHYAEVGPVVEDQVFDRAAWLFHNGMRDGARHFRLPARPPEFLSRVLSTQCRNLLRYPAMEPVPPSTLKASDPQRTRRRFVLHVDGKGLTVLIPRDMGDGGENEADVACVAADGNGSPPAAP